MVYESDFYTTRRPYSRPSPTITSYSVTDSPNDDIVSGRDKENDFKVSHRESKISFLDNTSEKSCDSDLEGDLADPYGPYSLFAKYLKPEKKSRVKLSKNKTSQPTPPKRISSLKNGDWQNRLRFSDNDDNHETKSFKSKFDLNKALFSPEKSPNPLLERYDFRTYDKEEGFRKDSDTYERTRPQSKRYDVHSYEKDEKIDPKNERVDRESYELSKPLSERYDFRTYEKEEGFRKDSDTFERTRPQSKRYDVHSYEKDEKIDPKNERVGREPYDLSKPLSERYGFRTYEKEENLDFQKSRKYVDTHERTRPLTKRYDVRTREKEEKIDPKKDRKDLDTYELTRPLLERYDIRDYEKEEKIDRKKERENRDTYDPKRPPLQRHDFRTYEKDENVDIKKRHKDRDISERAKPVSERYDVRSSYDEDEVIDLKKDRKDLYTYEPTRPLSERYSVRKYEEEKKDLKRSIKDRSTSYEKEEKKNLKGRETSETDGSLDEVVNGKKSPKSIKDSSSPLGLYVGADLKRGKPFYGNKTESFENLSDDEGSFAELLDKFHIGPYLQKAISLAKKSVSPKSTGDLPTSLTASNGRYKYSPSKLSETYSQTKSPEIDFEKKRSSQYLLSDEFDDEYNKENIWKNISRATVFSPDNTVKTLSSDSVSLRGDWTDIRNVRKAGTKTSPRADESRKNFQVGNFSSLERDDNDNAPDSAKRRPEIEKKGDSAFSIDNHGLDSEKKIVGYETSTAKGFAQTDWSGRYNTSEECIDLKGTSQTDDSEDKAPPAHYNLPYIAVKRLTLPQAAPPRSKVRNSVLMAEIDRINHRVRPALGFSAVEHYLNSRLALSRKYGKRQSHMSLRSDVEEESFDSCRKAILAMREKVEKKEIPLSAMVNFDDETRMIRAQTAALLKSVHTPLPRSRPLVLPTPSALMETPIPNRITSDAYIHGLLMPLSKVHTDVASRSFYVENPRPYIGKGHLACVSFAGGRAYAKRRSHLDEEPIHPRNVRNDIETLSFYSRARAVAKGEEPGPEPKAVPRKPRAYRPNTDAAREPAPRPRPAPVREEPVRETAPPPARAPEPAPAPAAAPTEAPITNGINGVEEDPELARLAEEEAELARMEAELAAQQAKKKKPRKQASEDAERAAEEARRAADEAAAASEAARQAEADEAARRAEADEAARKEAELEAEIERQVAAELAAEEERKREADLEAELERQVAAELAAEEAKKREEAELEAELERQVAAELAAEEARRKEAELEAEIERQVAAELEAERAAQDQRQEEAEQEVSNQEETDQLEIEPEPEPEPEVEADEVGDEPEKRSEGEPEPLSEAVDDEPVIDEPLSQADHDKSVNFWDADDDAAKVDEIDPLPED